MKKITSKEKSSLTKRIVIGYLLMLGSLLIASFLVGAVVFAITTSK